MNCQVGRVTPCAPFVVTAPLRRARSDAPYLPRSLRIFILGGEREFMGSPLERIPQL